MLENFLSYFRVPMHHRLKYALWLQVSFITIINLALFGYFVLSGTDSFRVQYTPDDAYYYLQLAKNFSNLGFWTFDSGFSVASGYHPLLAYLLVLFHVLFEPSTDSFVIIDLLISAVPIFILVAFIWIKGISTGDANVLMILSLLVSTRSFLFNSVSGVEWSLVVVLGALYCYFFTRVSHSRYALAQLFVTGLLLSLARSDAGLLPFSIFLASILGVLLLHVQNKQVIGASLSGFVGAVVGLLVVSINSFIFAGSFVQTSAKMKIFWGGFQEQLAYKSLVNLTRATGFDIYLISYPNVCISIILSALIIGGFLVASRWRGIVDATKREIEGNPSWHSHAILQVAAVICILAYFGLYSNGGGLQNWYTANLMVPTMICLYGLSTIISSGVIFKNKLVDVAVVLVIVVTITLNILLVYPMPERSPWPHQQAMLEAGKYLARNKLDGRIGSWNAGIIGYYQGGGVINLDGLVNESIYCYAVRNQLPLYISQNNIVYLVDFQLMFIPVFRARGGYDDTVFLERLVPIKHFDDGEYPGWKYLTLYKVQD
jgi:hypothetical protein